MNNKKGGAGGIVLLVLVLMIASAIGGAYAYRVIDGKMAVNDALKAVEEVDISDYDTAEQQIIQGYIDDTTKDLENAQTRKEVYEIISDFITNVDRVQTKKEKELAQALKEAEDAKKKLEEQQSSNNGNSYNNNNNGNDQSGQTYNDSNNSGTDSNSSSGKNGSYKSNDLNEADDGTDDSGGFLNSLLGGLSSGAGN